MPTATSHKQFEVYSVREGGAHGHTIDGDSHEEAALAFVEAWHPAADSDGEVSIIVREAASGREQCFRIDVFSGDAEPCS